MVKIKITNLSHEIIIMRLDYGYSNKFLAKEWGIDQTLLSKKINRKTPFTSLEIRTIRRFIDNLKPIKI